jgi:hypothetical protein
MVESAACMPQNLRLELIQSLFLVNNGKSAAFVPQNSNGATDGRRATDRPSYPNLLRSQMGYIINENCTWIVQPYEKNCTKLKDNCTRIVQSCEKICTTIDCTIIVRL